MPKNTDFWNFFDQVAAPQLAHRQATFRKIFEYLDLINGPIAIAETGCARLENNWGGDGQSTVMFDRYINLRDQESTCHTVDINPTSVAACKQLVSNRTTVTQADSVYYLSRLANEFEKNSRFISLLYLDSFDLDSTYWFQSAAHHLKELTALMRCINKSTLVVVDDCPLVANFIPAPNNQMVLLSNPSIGGKGLLVAEFANAVGAKLEFAEYQAGWSGF